MVIAHVRQQDDNDVSWFIYVKCVDVVYSWGCEALWVPQHTKVKRVPKKIHLRRVKKQLWFVLQRAFSISNDDMCFFYLFNLPIWMKPSVTILSNDHLRLCAGQKGCGIDHWRKWRTCSAHWRGMTHNSWGCWVGDGAMSHGSCGCLELRDWPDEVYRV